MKHYALILGGLVGPSHSRDGKSTEHRISTFNGTDALYIPVSTDTRLADAITRNFRFQAGAWGHIIGAQAPDGSYTGSFTSFVSFRLDTLGEFTDEEGTLREIVYFTCEGGASRRLLHKNDFDWPFRPSVTLSIAALSEDSGLSRYMTGSNPDKRGGILPVLQKIYEERGWK